MYQREGEWEMAEGKQGDLKEIVQTIEELLETIRYGSITLVVQDGKIIQIESHEKIRLK